MIAVIVGVQLCAWVSTDQGLWQERDVLSAVDSRARADRLGAVGVESMNLTSCPRCEV